MIELILLITWLMLLKIESSRKLAKSPRVNNASHFHYMLRKSTPHMEFAKQLSDFEIQYKHPIERQQST